MSFIHLLLNWYHTHQRLLPWRKNQNPYAVWLSEIILQQTRVNQGMAYFTKFLEAYPTIQDLARADEQEVLNLWQGLGYYSRARNLHKTAQIIVKDYDAQFPNNFQELKKLPGIGNYTAAAIASICFGEKVPAIDGNAYRVYARIFGLEKDISDSNAWKFYFEFAQKIMPTENTGDYNQAIMELGAIICLPQSPTCMFCPVQKGCIAFSTGKINLLPIRTRKVKVKKRYIHYYFIHYQNQFLVEKRARQGIWKNMYDFPKEELEGTDSKTQKFNDYHPIFKYKTRHILTHRQLFISFYQIEIKNNKTFQELSKNYQTITAKDIQHLPFPKPIADYLSTYFKV
ncbi:A/G-specific adenine glycosylase [Flavobacteriaceae bacterium Ap0902]|nr:A/G-specific adenine glycosylase [Flavobacteriaceae bacterium Ap0902]